MVEPLSQSREKSNRDCFQLRVGKDLWLLSGLGVVLLILLDQSTKIWASQASLISLNQGASFGISLPPSILILLTTLLLIGVGWGWWQVVRTNRTDLDQVNTGLTQLICYSLIVAGGISNLIDRLIWGGVRDWLPVPLLSLHNNLADWLIVVGCVGLVWSMIWKPPASKTLDMDG